MGLAAHPVAVASAVQMQVMVKDCARPTRRTSRERATS